MKNVEISEFKKFVRQTLMKKYHMSELEAQKAVQDSYLSLALKRDKNYVEHDSVEEWADFVYEEYQNGNLLQM